MQRPPLLRRFLLLTAVLLLHLLSIPVVFSQSQSNISDEYIRSKCTATLYPGVCYASLSRYSSAIQQSPARLARVAVGVTLSRAHHMASYVSYLSRQADYGSIPRAAAALHDCFSNFGDAVEEIRGSLKQMRQLGASAGYSSTDSFRFQISNVQTWMSAALTDEETCTDGFQDVPDGPLKANVTDHATTVKMLTSNALALVNIYAAQGIP